MSSRGSTAYVTGAIVGLAQAVACSLLVGEQSLTTPIGTVDATATAIAAWIGELGWLTRTRSMAAAGFLFTLFAPWGFLYFGPLTAVALGLGAVFMRPLPRL